MNTLLSMLLSVVWGKPSSYNNTSNLPAPSPSGGESDLDSASHARPTLSASRPAKHDQKKAITTLILDLGDVLFHYAVREIVALPPATFKTVITTPGWREFECGRVTEDEALRSITEQLSLDVNIIREALSQCRRLLHVDKDLYDRLKALKEARNGTLKVYAMTNISRDDFARLKNILPNWDLFDAEFTSFEAGMIKPDLGFYKYVLNAIDLDDPGTAVFVDDKLVNVDAARSLGIHGIVFQSRQTLLSQLRGHLQLPENTACTQDREDASR